MTCSTSKPWPAPPGGSPDDWFELPQQESSNKVGPVSAVCRPHGDAGNPVPAFEGIRAHLASNPDSAETFPQRTPPADKTRDTATPPTLSRQCLGRSPANLQQCGDLRLDLRINHQTEFFFLFFFFFLLFCFFFLQEITSQRRNPLFVTLRTENLTIWLRYELVFLDIW